MLPEARFPFGLEIQKRDERTLFATVINGRERIEVPLERASDGRYVFDFPHYAAKLVATLDESGRALDGEWTKRAGPQTSRTLPFHAAFGTASPRADDAATSARIAKISGKWRVRFEKDTEPAVAVFAASTSSPGSVEGTFLTATGDFRYLAGTYGEHLVLACFDGAHAFRFGADIQQDGTLKGTFSSGNAWTDTWTAVRDDAAVLGGEFERTHWDESYGWNDLWFPDGSGALVSLGDARFDGKARILQVTGSWCPNCHDETALLAELDREYRSKGLAITALCFELTGDRETDTKAARSMLERHRAEYPWLLVGRSDKDVAGQALPTLDRVFAFPTTIFVGRDGRVRAVPRGFRAGHGRCAPGAARGFPPSDRGAPRRETGRGRGAARTHHARTVARRSEAHVHDLRARRERNVALQRDGDDALRRSHAYGRVEAGTIAFEGTTVRLGEKSWTYDRRAHVLLDPSDCGERFTPAARSPFAVVDGVGYSEFAQVLEGLSSGNPIRRRESTYYLALQILADRTTPPEYGGGQIPAGTETNIAPLLLDPDPRVRATASWAVGAVGLSTAVPALEKNLSHGYAPVRREAARALKVLDAKAALESLAPLAAHDVDPLVRAAAAR